MGAARAGRLLGASLLAGALLAGAPVASAAREPLRLPPTYPFSPPPELRAPKRGEALPRLWDDGRPCSRGCRAPGAVRGWPIKPFDRQHPLRAGLNELRPANFHLGVDILAPDGTPVYALQPGTARVIAARSEDSRVQVGRFVYWHIQPTVSEGQRVGPYRDVVGTVNPGAGHLHLSEVWKGRYLNPLRPGGRVLAPWRDSAPPVLARPRFGRGGKVVIRGFDPQSSGSRSGPTPVLGLAGLAYRIFDGRGRGGPLLWALRGSQHLPDHLRRAVYAPGSRPAAANCSPHPPVCRPNWIYRLAGGLAPPLRLPPRRVHRLTAYAWDWAGNVRAMDTRLVFVGGEPFVSAGK